MRFRLKSRLDTTEQRREFAEYVSQTVCGGEYEDLPYQINEGDDSAWGVDLLNQIILRFVGKDTFEITHKYPSSASKVALSGLAAYLVWRTSAETEED